MSDVVVNHLEPLRSKPEISIAPMMDLTDHHCRYFLRLISPNSLLYTEMVTAQALIYGNVEKLLHYSAFEQPLAVQLAGSNPGDLAKCAKLAEDYGFAEINLNVGCPSDRVQKAKIGACLMSEPELVAECISAMMAEVEIPVTIKTRIGIDNRDSYEFLHDFITKTSKAGCKKFIIHARKAWLQGLNPKQNRSIPELNYQRVYDLKKDFQNLMIILNGGIESVADIQTSLQNLDGIMIGRAAYNNPYLLAEIEQKIFANNSLLTRVEIAEKIYSYILINLQQGKSWISVARHYIGLFKGQPGARAWRQFISESRDMTEDNIQQRYQTILDYIKSEQEYFILKKAG